MGSGVVVGASPGRGFVKSLDRAKEQRGDATNMSEAIPLGSALCVQGIEVVVSQAFHERLDLMLEFLAVESWDFGDVQGKTIAIESVFFS